MKNHHLIIKLIIAIIVGIIIGGGAYALGISQNIYFVFVARIGVTFTSIFSTFLNFIIPLLILSFIAAGLADLRAKAGRLIGITLILAYASTVIAGVAAYFASAYILPSFVGRLAGAQTDSISYEAFFTIEAAPLFGVMSALILAFLLGIGLSSMKEGALSDAVKDLQIIISKTLERVIIPLIPIHIACIFLSISAQGRLVSLVRTFASALALIVTLQIIYLIFEYAAASLLCKKNQLPKLRNAVGAYLTALGTQSSAATIPITLECAYRNGTNKDIADFCIPLCATIHLAGDTIALVAGTAALMLAGGQTVTFGAFVPFILMLGVTMIAAPGVPGGGVMSALGLITSMFGFDANLQQLIIALHFTQDSFGTATNVTGDLALALIVDKYDNNEKNKERKTPPLSELL